ncbi:unnamed protein product [Linum tenue]|uniref:Uncharacterized protein n=1 Tax=Linum tenue TaxID=586396 RepID=A0AAV0H7M9_9ROSI|nr:unnamed protein product [Linum tenue]
MAKSLLDERPMSGPFQQTRCPSCNGSGRVTCLCQRWSDGDLGCRTCAGSGRMGCSSCGGSGTGRPLPVQISMLPPNARFDKDWFQSLPFGCNFLILRTKFVCISDCGCGYIVE